MVKPVQNKAAEVKVVEVGNAEDDIEMEEQIHDYDKMVAVSVLENEMELMKQFIKKYKGHEQEFFKDKLSSLESSKDVSLIMALTSLWVSDDRVKCADGNRYTSEVSG